MVCNDVNVNHHHHRRYKPKKASTWEERPGKNWGRKEGPRSSQKKVREAQRNRTTVHAYDTYDSGYLTCSKKLTGSQLSLPHACR